MKGLIVSVSSAGFDWVVRYIDANNFLQRFDIDQGGAIDWQNMVGYRFEQYFEHGAKKFKFSEVREKTQSPLHVRTYRLTDNIQILDVRDGCIVFRSRYPNLDCIKTLDLKNISVIGADKIVPGNFLYRCDFGCGIPLTNAHLGPGRQMPCPHTGAKCNTGQWRALDADELNNLKIIDTRNKTKLHGKTGRVIFNKRTGKARV